MKALSKILAIVIPITLCITACDKVPQGYDGRIMVLSLSTDGHYAVSTDNSQHVVLWDLQSHTYKIIASKANIYSAYFIKNTNDFMYQSNKNNEVYVMNVDDKEIKTFNPGFPSYGQVMTSDLNTYIAIDENDQIFFIKGKHKTQLLWYWCGPDYKDEIPAPAGKPYTCGSFAGDGKLFNISLSADDRYFITSGSSEFYTWNATNGYFINDTVKNTAQTFATISPDGEYVLSGDSNAHAFIFNIHNGNVIATLDFIYNPDTKQNFDSEAAVSDINDWSPNDWIGRTTAIKFIDTTHYLVIFNMASGFMEGGFHYAGLFSLNKPKAINYLNLLIPDATNQAYPTTQDYARDQAIDTSPSAHILVMAQQNGNGILVYQYDPKTQTLKQVWAPTIQ